MNLRVLIHKWRARTDLGRRLAQFRRELLEARESRRPEALAQLIERRRELDLSEDAVALELELIDALLQSYGLQERLAAGHAPPAVETQHRAISGEPCYFMAAVSRPDSDMHETGKLFMTAHRCVFVGTRVRSFGWRKIRAVRDDDRDLVVVADGEALQFRCNTYTEVLRGVTIAQWLLMDQV